MVDKFNTFKSKSVCQTCKEEVLSIRFWIETGDVSWLCSKKHISRISLIPKKKKRKDFKDE